MSSSWFGSSGSVGPWIPGWNVWTSLHTAPPGGWSSRGGTTDYELTAKLVWECSIWRHWCDDVINYDVTRWSFLVPFVAEDLAKNFDVTSKRDSDCIRDFEFFHLSKDFDYSRFEIELPKILYFFPIHDAHVRFLIIQIQFLEETPLDQKSTWKFIFRVNSKKFDFLIWKPIFSFLKRNNGVYNQAEF